MSMSSEHRWKTNRKQCLVIRRGIRTEGNLSTLEKRIKEGKAKYNKNEDCYLQKDRWGGYTRWYPNRTNKTETPAPKAGTRKKRKADNTNGFIVYRWLNGDF